MTTSDLTLSPTAAQRLHDLSKAEGHPVMLRVAVEGGGCSGFQYQFDLVSSQIRIAAGQTLADPVPPAGHHDHRVLELHPGETSGRSRWR